MKSGLDVGQTNFLIDWEKDVWSKRQRNPVNFSRSGKILLIFTQEFSQINRSLLSVYLLEFIQLNVSQTFLH